MTANRSASVLARLLILAKQRGDDYNMLLNRFALERLLCRAAASPHADRFLLKGALLFSLWYDQPHRPTRDADLLSFGPDDSNTLISTFRDIAAFDLDDGIAFDTQSVRADSIREDSRYGGLRVRLNGRIANVRCALRIDVGFGDAVTPEPQTVVFPVLLDDLAAPTLRVYPVYTVIAEKYHAMAVLGLANTRTKDFFDIATIAQRTDLEGAVLARAIAATFARRGTVLPEKPPVALTREFGEDDANNASGKPSSARAASTPACLLRRSTCSTRCCGPRAKWRPAPAMPTQSGRPNTNDGSESLGVNAYRRQRKFRDDRAARGTAGREDGRTHDYQWQWFPPPFDGGGGVRSGFFALMPAGFEPLRRSALEITDTELRLIASAAIIGDSSQQVNGYSTPAASGSAGSS